MHATASGGQVSIFRVAILKMRGEYKVDQQNAEIMKAALELAQSCLDGLDKIKAKLNEGQLEDTMAYFNHIANSFYNILEAIQPVLEELPSNNLESLSRSLHQALGTAVPAYEEKDLARVLEIMQFTLLPAYRKWYEELDRCFRPIVEPN